LSLHENMKSSIVQILNAKTLYQGWATLKEYLINYTSSDGKLATLKREVFDSGDGAAVLMHDESRRKILLIRQYRIVADLGGDGDGWLLECCAGMLDNLEPEKAIIKEIEEETGYRLPNVTYLFAGYASPGAHMEKIYFYTGKYNETMRISTGGGRTDENEDIEIVEYDYSEIQDLIYSGKVIDQKTIVLLQWALLNLL
jgi:GDP-mannose pyrophosphatase NudK